MNIMLMFSIAGFQKTEKGSSCS